MDQPAARWDRHAELMCENFIGVFLSEELLRDSNKATGDKLRRFIHDQETFQKPRLHRSGEHGVVIIAIFNGIEYVLKVVSLTSRSWRFL